MSITIILSSSSS